MAVVVTGLEVFGDVGKCRQILWILSRTRDVTDLVFCYDVLQRHREIKRCKERRLIISSEPLHGKTNLIYYSSNFTHPKTIMTAAQFGFESFLESLSWNLSSGNVTGEHSRLCVVLIKVSAL